MRLEDELTRMINLISSSPNSSIPPSPNHPDRRGRERGCRSLCGHLGHAHLPSVQEREEGRGVDGRCQGQAPGPGRSTQVDYQLFFASHKRRHAREGEAPESVRVSVCESRKVFKKGALCEETRHISAVLLERGRNEREGEGSGRNEWWAPRFSL